MPQFKLVTPNRVQSIGKFPNIEEVKKLTIFKQNPTLIQYIQQVKRVKGIEKPSNRWRIITVYSYYDLIASYTREEAMKEAKIANPEWYAIKIPKYAYHLNDGSIS